MKNLQLTPPLLIVTMGYPGSGKTFFARQFADTYNLARVSEDRLRFELFAKPTFAKEEAEIIQSMSHYMLEQLMQTKQTILCEGSFLRLSERARVTELAEQHGYRVLFVWLQTDLETSAKRAQQRDRRNPDSKYSFPINKLTFQSIKETLDRPGEKEPVVVVSGKHAIKSQCLTVLRKITAIYSDNLAKGINPTLSGASRAPRQAQARSSQRFIQ